MTDPNPQEENKERDEHRQGHVCNSPLARRPILYNDSVGGLEAHRDDLWAVTTKELNALEQETATAKQAEAAKLRRIIDRAIVLTNVEDRPNTWLTIIREGMQADLAKYDAATNLNAKEAT